MKGKFAGKVNKKLDIAVDQNHIKQCTQELSVLLSLVRRCVPVHTAEWLTWTFCPVPQASQRISNQLHGTIALVRPGSRTCLLEKSPSGAAVSPPARKAPLPPEREHSPSLEA